MSEVASVFKSACFLSFFFQLFFSCPNDDYVLNTHDSHHARFRSGLYQLQGSYTSSREEEAVETAAVAASQTALSQQEPPVEFYRTPHRWGEMAVGLNTFYFKLLEKTKRRLATHCLSQCAARPSYMPAVFPATHMQHLHVFSEHWHQGDKGWGGGGCVVHSFFTSLMLSILWHCFSQVRLKRNMIVLTKREKEH